MKKQLYFFAFLLLIGISANTQNWKPFYKGDTINYKFGNNAEYEINTLWVDSAKVINGDSVFYMNRIIADCDTCTHLIGGTSQPCDTCYIITNQPQFLMRTIVKKTNGYYQLKDTASYYIKTTALLNEVWKFDSIHNIIATITTLGIENILTQPDSVKTISLSNGKTIKLSKSFGIISFPDFKGSGIDNLLIGVENRALGYKVSNYLDYFNYNVGDMLTYEGSYGAQGGWENYTIIKTITSKTVLSDKIQYNYTFYNDYTAFPGGHGTSTGNDCFEIREIHYSNLYNNQLTQELQNYLCSNTIIPQYYSKVNVTNIGKYIERLYTIHPTMPNILIKPQQSETGSDYYSITKLNGGEFSHRDYGFEYFLNYVLIEYSPVGIKPDISVISKISLSPNPCSNHTTFKTNKSIADNGYNIEIYDQQGRLLIKKQNITTEETIINLSSLTKGLYIYNVIDNKNNMVGKGKLIIQ